MRIIGGKYKGRALFVPQNISIRPTMDQTKEALFNMINNNFLYEDLKVLDLFSGSGNIAVEFYSRGCNEVTAVENNYKCLQLIQKNIEKLNIAGIDLIKKDVIKFIKTCRKNFDIIFADPPYHFPNMWNINREIFKNNLLNDNGWLIMEHSSNLNLSAEPNYRETRLYGQSAFSIFVNKIKITT